MKMVLRIIKLLLLCSIFLSLPCSPLHSMAKLKINLGGLQVSMNNLNGELQKFSGKLKVLQGELGKLTSDKGVPLVLFYQDLTTKKVEVLVEQDGSALKIATPLIRGLSAIFNDGLSEMTSINITDKQFIKSTNCAITTNHANVAYHIWKAFDELVSIPEFNKIKTDIATLPPTNNLYKMLNPVVAPPAIDPTTLKPILSAHIPKRWSSGFSFDDGFRADCAVLNSANNPSYGPLFYDKPANAFRISSYNIHFWNAPPDTKVLDTHPNWGYKNINAILNNIKKINADVLVLEEFANDCAKEQVNSTLYGENWKPTLDGIYPNTPQTSVFNKVWNDRGGFGNLLLIKPSVQGSVAASEKKFNADAAAFTGGHEARGYVHATFNVGGKKIALYGFHLDVKDKTGAHRKAEIDELITTIKQHDNAADYIIFMGDFNAVRMDDYNDKLFISGNSVRALLQKARDDKKEIETSGNNVHALLKTEGFVDCFTYSKTTLPPFTCSYASIVDFIYIKHNKSKLPMLNLKAGILWDAASDHVPLFIDILPDGASVGGAAGPGPMPAADFNTKIDDKLKSLGGANTTEVIAFHQSKGKWYVYNWNPSTASHLFYSHAFDDFEAKCMIPGTKAFTITKLQECNFRLKTLFACIVDYQKPQPAGEGSFNDRWHALSDITDVTVQTAAKALGIT